MNQIKDIDLSSSSFNGASFFETNHFCNSYNESIFSKKLSEMKRNSSPNKQYNQANNNADYDDEFKETPRKDSNNVLTNGFFSPRSTKMLKDYTLSEKIRIKWLRSIRDYVKLQEMQVVYNYLKTANVKVLIRGLRLRKCFTLWHLKHQELCLLNKWRNFSSLLVQKQRTERLKKDASKIRKARAAMVKVPTTKENGEGSCGVNEKFDELAEKTVQNMLQPILSLKTSEKPQSSEENDSHSKSSHHHHHHRNRHQSEENIKTRDLNIEVENEEANEDGNIVDENEARDKAISHLTNEKEILERRINDCEKRAKEQEQLIRRLIYIFIIISAVFAFAVFIAGIMIGKSMKSTERKLNTFISSQSRVTQDITAEVADFRVALTKIANLNRTVVPDS